MKKHLYVTLALAGVIAVAPAFAQTAGTKTTVTKTTVKTSGPAAGVSSSDKKFVMEAAQGGMEEVQLGQLAAQKASNADVKSFGQRMVDDHSKANDQLKQVAAQKGITLSDKLSPSKQKDVDKLGKLSGAAFDSAYVSMMVKDHKKDVAEFKKESTGAKDADVKSFASNTLPTLEDHLKMIQDISSKMHGGHSATTGGMHH